MDNFVGDAEAPRLASRLLEDQELLLMSAEEPTTFAAAEKDPSWWHGWSQSDSC